MDNKILKKFFKIDENEKKNLNEEEKEYLESLSQDIKELIAEEGELGGVKIKEIVLDDLYKNNFNNLIKYLGLSLDSNIIDGIDNKIKSESFLKIENTENDEDFFNNYLKDDIINDIIYSLKGYDKKAEGSKEVFIKKRASKIPNKRIDSINSILISKFNRVEFLTKKDDGEQALIIIFVLEQIFEILLEIPNDLCDTQKTIEILNACAVKLTNAVGLSEEFRKDLLETIRESYKNTRNQNATNQQGVVMQ